MKRLLLTILLLIKLSFFAQSQIKKPIFFNDSSTYKGIIKGYVPKSGNATGMVYINNIVKGIQESSLIRIEKDGSFKARFLMYYPQDVFVSFPSAGFKGCSFSVYFEPGKEVFQSFDPVTLKADVNYPLSTFSGELAIINTELAFSRNLYHEITYSPEDIRNNHKCFEDVMIERLSFLNKYKDSVKLNEPTFKFLKLNIRLAILNDYAAYIGSPEHMVLPERLIAFKKFLSLQSLNNEINVSSASYKYLINTLQYSKNLKSGIMEESWPEEAKAMIAKIPFTSNEKEELSKMKDQSEFVVFINTHPQYTGQIGAYFTKKSGLGNINATKLALGLPDGLMFDLMRTQIYSQLLEDFFSPFGKEELAEMKKNITSPFLQSSVLTQNEHIKARINTNRILAAHSKVEEAGTWEEILKKFKGKVIYVDFWATWCGPCREGIVEIAPLKDDLKGEDVAFVYITNQSSPLEIYENMIPSIKGNHFRLSNDEWNIISAKFKIASIPHYMLIGKDGKIISENFKPIGNEEMKVKLLNATKPSF